LDYLHNLLLNNFFFPDTAYQLVGFYRQENTLYAVVTQLFVRANQPTNLVILEGLHDENVLTQNGVLFFIDTVFYIKPEVFWN